MATLLLGAAARIGSRSFQRFLGLGAGCKAPDHYDVTAADEAWIVTHITRSHGRSPECERLRMTGMVAPMVLEGLINGDWLKAYVTRVLVPVLRLGDVVIMAT